MNYSRRRAVVCGASIAGLLACQVLSEFFESVTLIERDSALHDCAQRKGVPQGRHLHVLLTRGAQALAQLFPGFLDELVAAGAIAVAEGGPSGAYVRFGHHDLNISSDLADRSSVEMYLASRPFLEFHVRRRVRGIENVTIVEGHDVVAPIVGASNRVTGVRVMDRKSGEEIQVAADLVVDATGRAARASALVDHLGRDCRPVEQRYRVDLRYCSQFLRIPDAMVTEKMIVFGPTPQRPTGAGLIAYEHNTWIMTMIGISAHPLPADLAGMIDCTARFAPASLVAALRSAQPLGAVSTQRYLSSTWRRYDRTRNFPAGLLVIGDAICSLNPLYGQGMTLAALEAGTLRACLLQPDKDLARLFFNRAAKQIAPIWWMNRFNDLALFPGTGQLAGPALWLNRRLDTMIAAAASDGELIESFLRVVHLVDSPVRLLQPSVTLRLFGAHRRARRRERQSARLE